MTSTLKWVHLRDRSDAGTFKTGALQDASAEDLLLALLRASATAKEGRPGSAAQRQTSSAAVQPARDGTSGLQDALPYLAAGANGASAPAQRVSYLAVRPFHLLPAEGARRVVTFHLMLYRVLLSFASPGK